MIKRYDKYKRKNSKVECKYCGSAARTGDICELCRKKLPLVKKIIAIGSVIKEQATEERRQREEKYGIKESTSSDDPMRCHCN